MDKKPFVSICCLSYNHYFYIEECIKSLLAQETNFEYEIIIHDDASTDGTIEILKKYEKKYGEKIHVIYEKDNQYSRGISVFDLTLRKASGKYIAFCECDDYWCDNKKLQKCTDFLENNVSFFACTHQTKIVNLDGEYQGLFYKTDQKDGEISLDSYLSFPHTSSYFFRNPLFDINNKDCIEKYKYVSGWDKSFAIFFLSQGKVFYFDEVLSCYRVDLKKGNSFMANEAKNNIFQLKIKIENQLNEQINIYKMKLNIDKHYYYSIIIYEINFYLKQRTPANLKYLVSGIKKAPHKIKCFFYISYYYLRCLFVRNCV